MADTQTRAVKTSDGWTGQCAQPCGFLTSGWPTKALATERIGQHAAEHDTGEPMPELEEFRQAKGLTVNADGAAVFADLED
jgi:hypothetical protein